MAKQVRRKITDLSQETPKYVQLVHSQLGSSGDMCLIKLMTFQEAGSKFHYFYYGNCKRWRGDTIWYKPEFLILLVWNSCFKQRSVQNCMYRADELGRSKARSLSLPYSVSNPSSYWKNLETIGKWEKR